MRCWLLAFLVLGLVTPSRVDAQIARAPADSMKHTVQNSHASRFQPGGETSVVAPDPSAVAATAAGLLPVPRLGAWIGIASGAVVGAVYAWGLGGEGWLGDTDTAGMVLVGAVAGAVIGYAIDVVVHTFRP